MDETKKTLLGMIKDKGIYIMGCIDYFLNADHDEYDDRFFALQRALDSHKIYKEHKGLFAEYSNYIRYQKRIQKMVKEDPYSTGHKNG